MTCMCCMIFDFLQEIGLINLFYIYMRKVGIQIYSKPILNHSSPQGSPEPAEASPQKSKSKIQKKNFKQLILPKVKICEIGPKVKSEVKHRRYHTNHQNEGSRKKSISELLKQQNEEVEAGVKSFDDIIIKQEMERYEQMSRFSIRKKNRLQPYHKLSYIQSKKQRKRQQNPETKQKQNKKEHQHQDMEQKMQRFCSQIIDEKQKKERQKIIFKPHLWTKNEQLKDLKARLQQFLKNKVSTHHIRSVDTS